jgi:hypothetical protein
MGKLLRCAQDPLLRHVAEPSVVPEAPSFALAVQICCQVFRCWGACLSRAPLTVGILQCGELLEDASRGSTVHEDTRFHDAVRQESLNIRSITLSPSRGYPLWMWIWVDARSANIMRWTGDWREQIDRSVVKADLNGFR